jgi:2-dehydro-3-deoxyphosphogluconate aldolase/(4S)-4-hydroxy-2-oxoglutarate aldolase
MTMTASELLRIGPVIPVIVLDDVASAVPLARALVAGGIRVLEVTLRTPVALDAVRAIARDVTDAIVGVGTITRAEEITSALAAGARFGVSPGLSPTLIDAARASALPFLPGVMTPSEIIAARTAGSTALKLFPAQQAGGVAMLNALAGPFPDIVFCPTGGITAANAPQYLACANVGCVGGSWLAPKDAITAADWPRITSLARDASALRG